MLKQKVNKFTRVRIVTGFAAVILLVAVLPTKGFGVFAASCSSTADCQQQINNLSAQSDQAQQSLGALEAQASSYQDAINKLEQQINDLQQQIVSSQNQEDQLNTQIAQAQTDLDQQKKVLGQNIKQMYLEGNVSTLEMLASSKNLSDYVNKQTYRNSVQDKVKDTLDKINALKVQLQQQKAQIDQLLKSQQFQRQQLAATEDQQSQLLGYNQNQQSNFDSQIAANQSQIASLRRQQASLIQSGTRNVVIPPASGGSGGWCDSGSGNGNYPMSWCNADQDTVPTIPYSSDPINRECTSYAYWYFTQIEGHTDFRATGNAKDWYYTSNYVVHDSPAVGSMAVETTGAFGHVAIVQALPGQTYAGNTVPDGYVLVSEMNYDFNGHFRYSYSPLSKFAGYIF